MVDEIILKDNEPICCGRPGGNLPATDQNLFPNGGGDNFSSVTTGEFQVLDTDGAAGETLTFGLFSDDHSGLHILGQSFTAVSDFSGDGDAVLALPDLTNNDTFMLADYATGHSNAFGLITLQEGNYDFEAFQRQGTGDAGMEIWVASGDQTATGFNAALFTPLTSRALTLAANQGLALVAGPGTGPIAGPGLTGDFNGNGFVDAADYVLWRDGRPLQNEGGITPGTATPEDFQTWRANFGKSTPGSAAAGAVPEASTLLTGAIAVLLGFVCRCRRV
jgi:hypothetical protein